MRSKSIGLLLLDLSAGFLSSCVCDDSPCDPNALRPCATSIEGADERPRLMVLY